MWAFLGGAEGEEPSKTSPPKPKKPTVGARTIRRPSILGESPPRRVSVNRITVGRQGSTAKPQTNENLVNNFLFGDPPAKTNAPSTVAKPVKAKAPSTLGPPAKAKAPLTLEPPTKAKAPPPKFNMSFEDDASCFGSFDEHKRADDKPRMPAAESKTRPYKVGGHVKIHPADNYIEETNDHIGVRPLASSTHSEKAGKHVGVHPTFKHHEETDDDMGVRPLASSTYPKKAGKHVGVRPTDNYPEETDGHIGVSPLVGSTHPGKAGGHVGVHPANKHPADGHVGVRPLTKTHPAVSKAPTRPPPSKQRPATAKVRPTLKTNHLLDSEDESSSDDDGDDDDEDDNNKPISMRSRSEEDIQMNVKRKAKQPPDKILTRIATLKSMMSGSKEAFGNIVTKKKAKQPPPTMLKKADLQSMTSKLPIKPPMMAMPDNLDGLVPPVGLEQQLGVSAPLSGLEQQLGISAPLLGIGQQLNIPAPLSKWGQQLAVLILPSNFGQQHSGTALPPSLGQESGVLKLPSGLRQELGALLDTDYENFPNIPITSEVSTEKSIGLIGLMTGETDEFKEMEQKLKKSAGKASLVPKQYVMKPKTKEEMIGLTRDLDWVEFFKYGDKSAVEESGTCCLLLEGKRKCVKHSAIF